MISLSLYEVDEGMGFFTKREIKTTYNYSFHEIKKNSLREKRKMI